MAAERGDARTGLEAEAYAASMAGTLLLERDQPQKALTNFNRAKCAIMPVTILFGSALSRAEIQIDIYLHLNHYRFQQ